VANPLTQVLMTYDGQDKYRAAYAYGLDRIEVQAVDDTRPESQDPLYYLHDGLGSVTQMVRPNGEVRDHYSYDEYGVPAPGAKLSEDGRNVNHNAFGYTGESLDEEDNLLYLRSRYYAPDLGRFMTRDVFPGRMVKPLSMHKYAYVDNSPVNYVDPLGFNKKESNKQATLVVGSLGSIEVTISQSGEFNYDTKLAKQMLNRGWTEQRIQEAINNPSRTVKTVDNRFRPDGSGIQNFEPATAYYHEEGGYVVRNDANKNIVQVQDMNNPNWKAPWDNDNDDSSGGNSSEGEIFIGDDGKAYVRNEDGELVPYKGSLPIVPLPVTVPVFVPGPVPVPIPIF
ncbi:MAG: colicin E5-related ribonuclease, partial [Eubacteriales bacterium]